MAFVTFQKDNRFGPRKGLEGPYSYPSGKVLYYDTKEGKYYDPTSDFYLDYEEAKIYLNEIFDALRK